MTQKTFSLSFILLTILAVGTYTYVTSAEALTFDEISGNFYVDEQSILMTEADATSL